MLEGASSDSPSVAAARLLQIIEARFAEGLRGARDVHASGPRSDADALRVAYLDVLKLCLCDLAGTTTTSVARTQDGTVMSRELADEKLRLRAAGMDWPRHGLTMVGLRRLDDLQTCVESVVRDGVPGDVIEAGSWRGGASMFMRAALDSLGESERTVWVADSFQGFPQAEPPRGDGYDLSNDLAGCDFLAVPLVEVRANFARFGLDRGVNFVQGFFQQTLPPLQDGSWSVVRIDGDTYDSVQVALRALYPGLSVGGHLVIDDYFSLDECREAVEDFRAECEISEPIEQIDWSSGRWRRVTPEPEGTRAAPPGAPAAREVPHAVPRASQARIPTIEELELAEENERLRERLASTEAALHRITRSPVAASRALLSRMLGAWR
jgi:O-methyltransferase